MRFVSQQQKEILKTSRGPNESYLKLWNNTKERPSAAISCCSTIWWPCFFKECCQCVLIWMSTQKYVSWSQQTTCGAPSPTIRDLRIESRSQGLVTDSHPSWSIPLDPKNAILYSITFYITWKVFIFSFIYHSSEFIFFPNSIDWRKEVDFKNVWNISSLYIVWQEN